MSTTTYTLVYIKYKVMKFTQNNPMYTYVITCCYCYVINIFCHKYIY